MLEANTEAAGKTLGRYKILGELGRGAMGAVYRAIDPLIDREVAIKTLLPNLPEEAMAEVKERFIREARSAGRLNHPNIVTVFDVGEQDGMAYMAMEILRGRSLQQILKEGDRLPFERTADIAAQVAEALDNAQEHGIAHRDVKPANVMVNDAWHCKLTDFGVAYVPSSTMTQTGAALGSPRYMSPEQVLGLRVDPRCDIFSLGVMLYEMLSNRTPFEHPSDTSVFQLMNRIAGEPHTPIRNIDSAIPEAFEQILSRALAKKPEQRYARAGEMAADLRNVQRGIPPAAVPAYEKTVLASTTPRGRALPRQQDDLARTQLLNDLDSFVENFEKEEQDRLQAEAAERARKEEKLRSWTSFEGALPPAAAEKKPDAGVTSVAAETYPGATTVGRRALDMLRKQSAALPPREDPAVARNRAINLLDQAMRATFTYLAEFVKEMNEVTPASGKPYEFLYLGKLPSVNLTSGFVDSRPLHIPGKDVTATIMMRYRIMPTEPVKVSIMGADIARCMEYLKSLKVEYKAQAEARNDFGKVTKALFTVHGALPCELSIRGDFDNPGAALELINVRQLGRSECRLTVEELKDAGDDLARWILGVDDDFEKFLRRK